MFAISRRSSLALLSLCILILAGCASTHEGRTTATGTFPVPDEIQPNVDFWRKVYGEWSRSQVAIHDDEHMDLIYEIVELPGEIRGGYTSEQQRVLDYRLASYRIRLSSLEDKVRAGASLSGNDRELYQRIADTAGSSAVYGASERLRLQRGVRERFRRGVEISGRYDAAFREIFRAHGLPEDLAYLPHVESSFQVNARSSVGAAGVWQFMPATGRVYDLRVTSAVDERLDPVVAAEGAARYLDSAYRKLGSWPLAITSYNHGQGGMQKAKNLYGDDIGRIVTQYRGPYFGFASRNFYAEFLAAREVAGNPKKYFPGGVAYEPPLSHDRLVLSQPMPAHHIARHYGVSVYQLQSINLAWRDPVVDGRAHIPAGTKVWLPAGSLRTAGRPSAAPSLTSQLVAMTESAAPRPTAKPPAKPVAAKSKPQAKAAIAKAEPRSRTLLAKADSRSKTGAARKAAAPAKVHVVKPNETLYRVALRYDMTVEELKKLNRMNAKEDTIRAGQRLRVSG